MKRNSTRHNVYMETDTFLSPPILFLKDLTRLLKETIEGTFSSIRVRAEVSSLKRHSSGHVYFCLKDDEAVLDAVCWRGTLDAAHATLLNDGLEIIATGRLTIYGARSRYQMVVESFEPAGEGALLKLLVERKNRLASEGLFDTARKKPLPRLPHCIGVITSPTGSVIQDILHRLRDRYPCHVLVWPVAVQGQGSADEITAAIQGFQTLAHMPDVIIVARGGGSLEDLWSFNEENVVRAAADCKIPLISAVGHETDTTLIDFAADVRAPTPTAAAELATPMRLADLWLWVEERKQRLALPVLQLFERLMGRLQAISPQRIHPRHLIEDKMQSCDDWIERFSNTYRLNLERWGTTLSTLSHSLDQISYKKTLERGFVWVTSSTGQTITTKAQTRPNQSLKLTFSDGSVSAKLTSSSSGKKYDPTFQPKLF